MEWEKKHTVYDRDCGGSKRPLPKQGRELHVRMQRANLHANELPVKESLDLQYLRVPNSASRYFIGLRDLQSVNV